MNRRRRGRPKLGRPPASDESRLLALQITSSPMTPPNKRNRIEDFEIDASPIMKPKFQLLDIAPASPLRPTTRTPKKLVRYEILPSPKTPKIKQEASSNTGIEIAPETPKQRANAFEIAPITPQQSSKPVAIEIHASPLRNSQIRYMDSSHWFQYRIEDKRRVRKSLNAVLSVPNCALLNKMHAMFASLALERANHMNSTTFPDESTAIDSKNNVSSPHATVIVNVIDVKYMNTLSSSIRIKFTTCVGLIADDIFFRSDEEGIMLLDNKTSDGMGLKCGTKLRLTYPLSWNRINGQIVIHNIFWIQVIARDLKFTRERNDLFNLRCLCQVRSSNNEPLCSSSQCDGELPIGYLSQDACRQNARR